MFASALKLTDRMRNLSRSRPATTGLLTGYCVCVCTCICTDDRDWSICCSLLDAKSTGFGPKRLRCSVRPLFPIKDG